jgi:hypothetical protein
MIKQTEILIRTGEGKFIPIGTAELELELEYDIFYKRERIKLALINRLDINIKKGNILWERIPENCYD